MSLTKINIFLVSLCVLLMLFLATWFFVFKTKTTTQTFDTSHAAVIKEVRALQRLETASFTIEKVIDSGTTGNNVFQQFLFGDKILLIAHGQVIAGFDLAQISDKDVEVDGTSIHLTLPAPQILVTTLDNTQTKVYDRQKGILNPGNKDLESDARKAAENAIKDAACSGDILKQASDNARKQLTSFFMALGFEQVSIDIPNGSCK
jgi:hypothetical protein